MFLVLCYVTPESNPIKQQKPKGSRHIKQCRNDRSCTQRCTSTHDQNTWAKNVPESQFHGL